MVLIALSLVMAVYALGTISGVIMARGVPFVPLTRRKLIFLNKNIQLKSEDKLVDLGCGDGCVLRLFEKQGVKILSGYEVNFWAFTLAKLINIIKHSRSKIYFKNFFKINLAEYNVVFCYLLEKQLSNLKEKFDQELKPGAKIISFDFEIKNWHKPVEVFEENKSRIFVYKI